MGEFVDLGQIRLKRQTTWADRSRVRLIQLFTALGAKDPGGLAERSMEWVMDGASPSGVRLRAKE